MPLWESWLLLLALRRRQSLNWMRSYLLSSSNWTPSLTVCKRVSRSWLLLRNNSLHLKAVSWNLLMKRACLHSRLVMVCVCVCDCLCMCVFKYVSVSVWVCTCLSVCLWVCTSVYVNAKASLCMSTHLYIQMHIVFFVISKWDFTWQSFIGLCWDKISDLCSGDCVLSLTYLYLIV